jgi:hypothetical protein
VTCKIATFLSPAYFFISSLQWVLANVTISLCTEFQSQVQWQQEDSAMILASMLHKRRKTKKGRTKNKRGGTKRRKNGI